MVSVTRSAPGIKNHWSCFLESRYSGTVAITYTQRKKHSSANPMKKKVFEVMNGKSRPEKKAKGVKNNAVRARNERVFSGNGIFIAPSIPNLEDEGSLFKVTRLMLKALQSRPFLNTSFDVPGKSRRLRLERI
jgi:hypothetical protein